MSNFHACSNSLKLLHAFRFSSLLVNVFIFCFLLLFSLRLFFLPLLIFSSSFFIIYEGKYMLSGGVKWRAMIWQCSEDLEENSIHFAGAIIEDLKK